MKVGQSFVVPKNLLHVAAEKTFYRIFRIA